MTALCSARISRPSWRAPTVQPPGRPLVSRITLAPGEQPRRGARATCPAAPTGPRRRRTSAPGPSHLAPPFAFARPKKLPLDERAVAGLELAQLREGHRDRQLVRISGINPGDQRINRLVEKLPAQAADDEFRDALLLAVAARRHERLAQEGQLGLGGEQRAGKETRGRCPAWPPAAHSARRRTRLRLAIGVEPPAAQSRIPHQLPDPGKRLEDRVRSEFRQIPSLADGLDDPAHSLAGLIDRYRQALSLQTKPGGQPGNAAADNGRRMQSRLISSSRTGSPCVSWHTHRTALRYFESTSVPNRSPPGPPAF